MHRILIVDDEKSICKALEMGLRSPDFDINIAFSGNAALMLGHHYLYDIIIADISLPDMSGLEVIRDIKQVSPDIIAFVITGNGTYKTTLEAIRLEVRHYFEKPLNLDSIRIAILKEIKRTSLKQEALKKHLQQALNLIGADEFSALMLKINSALMAITGNAEIARMKLDSDDPEELTRRLNKIIEKSKIIATEINQYFKIQDLPGTLSFPGMRQARVPSESDASNGQADINPGEIREEQT